MITPTKSEQGKTKTALNATTEEGKEEKKWRIIRLILKCLGVGIGVVVVFYLIVLITGWI